MPVKTNTKDRIDEAALRLFATKGFDQATTRDIATEAGIAEGSIYRHYRNKETLARELFVRHYGAMGERLQGICRSKTGFRAKLGAMVAEVCALHDDRPELFAFLLLTQHDQLKDLPASCINPVDVIASAIQDAMDQGEIPAGDPEIMTALVFGAVIQPATFRIYGRIRQPMRDIAPILASVCWRALS